MSATREVFERHAAPLGPALRRMFAQLAIWLGLLLRPPFPQSYGLRASRHWLACLIVGAAAILAVGASMWLLDDWAIARQRQLPPWVIGTFASITEFGKSGWFLWPIGILVIALAAPATRDIGRRANLVITSLVLRLEFLFFAIGIPALIVTIVKRLIGRVRPSDLGPFQYVPFSWRPDYASMPSGHSTAAFAAAFAVGAVWPRARVPMWIYALVIAISRVAVHAHFPSDVIAGAFVGILGAVLVRDWFAARRLAFVPTQAGVASLPGPSAHRLKRLAARVAGR